MKQKHLMKTKYLLILFCLASCTSWAQQTHLDIKVPSRVENDLLGPIQSVCTVYNKESYQKSGQTKQTKREEERTYDLAGNMLASIKKNITDDTTEHTQYLYSSNGCLYEKITTNSETETNETFRYSIHVPSRQILRRNLNTEEIHISTYTTNGYWHYYEDRDASNNLTKVTRVKRLPNNKEYEFQSFDGDGAPTSTSQIDWNTHGLTREFRYYKHGTNAYTFITKHTHPKKDTHGNWLKRISRVEMIRNGKKETSSQEVAEREIIYFDALK